MRITPKRAFAIVGGIISVISFSRICVLFLEALSAVKDERSQDAELLVICASGAARGSMKMRAACLQAQADRASPIILKAVLRAVSIAFEDFSESVSSPGKLFVVVMFVVSSLFLPITSYVRAIFPADSVVGSPHIVVLAHESTQALSNSRIGFRNRLAGAIRMRGNSSPVRNHQGDFDVEDTGCELVDVNLVGPSYPHTKWE